VGQIDKFFKTNYDFILDLKIGREITMDFFAMFNMFFITVVVVAVIFLIIVIIIVYKLLHSNVDNKRKKSKQDYFDSTDNPYRKREVKEEPKLEDCPYCGEKIELNIVYCPNCGAEIKK
jgi:uncharacterized membrane protein